MALNNTLKTVKIKILRIAKPKKAQEMEIDLP